MPSEPPQERASFVLRAALGAPVSMYSFSNQSITATQEHGKSFDVHAGHLGKIGGSFSEQNMKGANLCM